MIVQQTQNAFNDKAAQFLLVPLAGAVGARILGFGLESVAGVVIALPFILFAPLAGWLSDRFSKRDVMLGSAIAQLAILGWLCAAVHFRQMPLAMAGFFALAVQSAFFSPAKIGINKELVGSRHLGFAASVQQMTAMLAILTGQISMGFLFDERLKAGGGGVEAAWGAAYGPLLAIAVLAVPAIVLACLVPRTPAQGARPLRAATAVEHFTHLRDLWSDRRLRQASFGVAFFWGFAAFLNLWSIKIARQLTDGGEGFGSLSSWFMTAAGVGMALGFAASSWLLRRRIELGWVPVAGLAMTLCALGLAAVDPRPSLALAEIGPAALFRPSATLFLWVLGFLAFFAAIFLAPLNAWMQDRYPPARRGELQSAVNLQDCLAGVLAVVFLEACVRLLRSLGAPPLTAYRLELVAAALGCGAITWFIIRLLPAHFMRVIGLTLIRLVYRVRTIDPQHVPAKGGVLLLPNHVTWADAFFLTAACPRPVRFVMEAAFMKNPLVRAFCRTFDTLPLATGKPREALRTAAAALEDGDVVCLFPEGQLTRTGTLRELKRGFELVARQAGAPCVPAWIDGAWGSIFSYERNRFFRKVPYRVPYGLQVAFGAPLPAGDARLDRVREGIHRASSATLARRFTISQARRANAYQLGQLNSLQRRRPFVLVEEPGLPLETLAAFSRLFSAPMRSRERAATCGHWVGGRRLRESLPEPPVDAGAPVFFDFSPQALEPLDAAGWIHCPGLAIDGVIVALSVPTPPLPLPGSRPQPGGKPGSFGLLLPGFATAERDGHLVLHAPPLGEIELPEGFRLDEEGFLFGGS